MHQGRLHQRPDQQQASAISAFRRPEVLLPSNVEPEEVCILINPTQADSASISAIKSRRWLYDPRLAQPPPRKR